MWEMGWAGHDIIRERVNTYSIQCDLKWGYLEVAIKQRHLRDQHTEWEQLQKYDFPHEYRVLSRDETVATIGTEAYIGALLNMGNGHLHPLNLCIGEARAAVSHGAKIYEQSPVVKIEHGDKPRVIAAGGSVTADMVVIAGNAYHHVDPGLRGTVFPVNSYVITTQPLTEAQIAIINPQDLAVCDPNFVLEYFRLTADKRLLFGARCNYSGDDAEVIKNKLVPKMLKIYPQLAGMKIDYTWGGKVAIPFNLVPQLGRISSNVFYSQGYSGHGVNVTHLSGQIMADVVAGTFERFDVFADIDPVIIPGAHTFSNQMVALGILYYQIKDRL